MTPSAGLKHVARFFLVTYLWILLLPHAVTFAGAASNQLALIANGGTMPVQLNDISAQAFLSPDDPIHVRMTHQSHLKVLADIFNFHDEIDSVGDLLLRLGDQLDGFCLYVWIALITRKVWRSSLAS
jgi:hypothetical protein